MECSNQKIQFTLAMNKCHYFVDNSDDKDTIIVRLYPDSSKNYSVYCCRNTSQTHHKLAKKFDKYKSFVEMHSKDLKVITIKYSNVVDAVNCMRDLINDKETPSFGMKERLVGTDKNEFLHNLTKYNLLDKYQNALKGIKKGKKEPKATINKREDILKTSETKPKVEDPIIKFSRVIRNWITPEVINSIVVTLDTNEYGMYSLLTQTEEIKIKPTTVPPLMHALDLYMEPRVKTLPLHDVLITGFPNYLSYRDIRKIVLTHTDMSALQNVNVLEEIIEGIEYRFSIVYLTSSEAANYLAKSLNKTMVRGKQLSAVTFSDLDAQWKELHKKINI